MDQLLVKRLSPAAKLPWRATPGSAGADLFACLQQPVEILPGQTAAIPTGIAIQLPAGQVALVFGRSGLGLRYGIAPANAVGVIDSDYRGEIIVGLHNHSQSVYTIQPQERIAQLVVLPVCLPSLVEADELEESQRGAGGFGSTGN